MKILATYNIKGGVGKTAAAVNLAHLSARGGARTLLWDLDPQGAATFYFRIRPRIDTGIAKLVKGKRRLAELALATDFDNLDLLPGDFDYRHLDLALDRAGKPDKRLRRLFRPLADEYDVLFLDCAPSISLVSEGIFHVADILLVPTIPTTLSLRTLRRLRKHLKSEGIDGVSVLPFFSMVDQRKAMHRSIVATGGDGQPGFLRSSIPYSSTVEKMGQKRSPVTHFSPTSAAARAFEALWTETAEHG